MREHGGLASADVDARELAGKAEALLARSRWRNRGREGFLLPRQELKRRAMKWAVRLRVNPREIRIQEMRRK